jgi:DNA-binding transcriptional ArsR family regulator
VNSGKARSILDLYQQKKLKLAEVTHSQYVIKVLDTIFAAPIFNTTDFISRSRIPRPTAMRLLKLLKKEGILSTMQEGSGRRAEVMMFNKLIRIVA